MFLFQANQHCGWDCEGVASGAPAAQPAPAPVVVSEPVFVSNGKYRSDARCGAQFPLESGEPAECDPNSEFW